MLNFSFFSSTSTQYNRQNAVDTEWETEFANNVGYSLDIYTAFWSRDFCFWGLKRDLEVDAVHGVRAEKAASHVKSVECCKCVTWRERVNGYDRLLAERHDVQDKVQLTLRSQPVHWVVSYPSESPRCSFFIVETLPRMHWSAQQGFST